MPETGKTGSARLVLTVTTPNNSVNGAKTASTTSSIAAVRVSVGVDGLAAYLGTLAAGE